MGYFGKIFAPSFFGSLGQRTAAPLPVVPPIVRVIGSQDDCAQRIISTLPFSWFGFGAGDITQANTPIIFGLIQGFAYGFSLVYSLYAYAKLQTRIATATDGWLDMISADFFGTLVARKPNQSDASYRAVILANLLRPRATRAALIQALTTLTGRVPIVFEPERPLDTGGYAVGGAGYGMAGGYGSLLMPYQALVKAFRPLASGVPNVIGYSCAGGGYGVASQIEYASLSMIITAATDADIYSVVDAVKPAGTTVWVQIQS